MWGIFEAAPLEKNDRLVALFSSKVDAVTYWNGHPQVYLHVVTDPLEYLMAEPA